MNIEEEVLKTGCWVDVPVGEQVLEGDRFWFAGAWAFFDESDAPLFVVDGFGTIIQRRYQPAKLQK